VGAESPPGGVVSRPRECHCCRVPRRTRASPTRRHVRCIENGRDWCACRRKKKSAGARRGARGRCLFQPWPKIITQQSSSNKPGIANPWGGPSRETQNVGGPPAHLPWSKRGSTTSTTRNGFFQPPIHGPGRPAPTRGWWNNPRRRVRGPAAAASPGFTSTSTIPGLTVGPPLVDGPTTTRTARRGGVKVSTPAVDDPVARGAPWARGLPPRSALAPARAGLCCLLPFLQFSQPEVSMTRSSFRFRATNTRAANSRRAV